MSLREFGLGKCLSGSLDWVSVSQGVWISVSQGKCLSGSLDWVSVSQGVWIG